MKNKEICFLLLVSFILLGSKNGVEGVITAIGMALLAIVIGAVLMKFSFQAAPEVKDAITSRCTGSTAAPTIYFYLTPQKMALLREYSNKSGVKMADILRNGVDMTLRQAGYTTKDKN